MKPRAANHGRAYVLTWLALLALAAVSFALAQVTSGAAGVAMGLAVALVKATLIGLFFMRLAEEKLAPRLVAASGVVFIGVICLGILADVAFR